MVKYCCVKGCGTKGEKGFFSIPAKKFRDRRRSWLKAIYGDESPTLPGDSRICGAHFISGKPSNDPLHPDYRPQLFQHTSQGIREKVKLDLEQYWRAGQPNYDQYQGDFRPQKIKLSVCPEQHERAGCEQPQPSQQEKVSSCPPQPERVNFCEDCSSKRVREVKAQLEKLFTEKSWKSNHCGICNRRFLSPSVAILLKKKVPVTMTTKCLNKSDSIATDHDYVYSKRTLEDCDFKDHPVVPKSSGDLQNREGSCETSKKIKMSWVKPGVLQVCVSPNQNVSKSEMMDSSEINKDNVSDTSSADKSKSKNDSNEINEGLIKVDTDKTPPTDKDSVNNTDSLYESNQSENLSTDKGDVIVLPHMIKTEPVLPNKIKTEPIAKDSLNNTDSLYESNQNKTLPADKDDLSNVLPYKNKATPIIHLDLSDATKGLDSRVIAMLDRSARNPFQPFKCKHCTSREYEIAGSFVKHMQQTHQEGEAITKPYVCNKCGKQFLLMEQLQAHLVNHETFHCPYPPCLRTFPTKGALSSHERVHKPEDQTTHGTKQPLVCSFCGKLFMHKSKLNVHEACHSDDRPFECSQCGKAFKLQSVLKTHVRAVHDNDKPFMCEVCGIGWIGKKDLSIHMRTHSGEKPYSCSECDYRCARKDYMDKHKRIHTGEKPYKCKHCSKAFTQYISLTLHRKKYHPEKVTKTKPADDFVTVQFPGSD